MLQEDVSLSHREHRTNEHVWQQVTVLAGRQKFLLLSVTSYHVSAMIRCRNGEQWMVVVTEEDRVNHVRTTTSRNGLVSLCRHCYAPQTIEVDG